MMRHVPILLVSAGLAFASAGADAQTAGAFMANPAFADPPPAQCITTFDMQHCNAHDLRVADKAMSDAYAAARARRDAAGRRTLLAAQRRWLAMRDRSCIAAGKRYAGGTLQGVEVTQCWVNVTRARTKALKTGRG